MKKEINDFTKSLIDNRPSEQINIMEVCGTHTMAISRNGLRQILPDQINLISGPGCPVCVTSSKDIDWMIEIIMNYPVTLFTFGDMIRVPGSASSLQFEKASGKDIRICYSPLDALDFAKNNPERDVIFIAIGFETTIPLTSVIVKRAYEENINNFYIFNIHKLVPPALELLLLDEEIKIDGFLCPGHVSAIIGSLPYEFIAAKYRTPCVISGFEPADIMESLDMLVRQYNSKKPAVEIQYKRVVTSSGNPTAVSMIDEIFEPCDSYWRGIGNLPGSGLKLREEYEGLDAMKKFPVGPIISKEPPGCQCGSILKGIIKPFECKLFAKACRPENPIGPCMVSSEGSCAAYYKYERSR